MVGIGTIFTLAMLMSDREGPIFGMLALITWFATAGSAATVEVPYTHLWENSVDNTYLVIEGVQQVTESAPLTYFFMGMGLFCFVYVFIIAFRMIAGRSGRKMI